MEIRKAPEQIYKEYAADQAYKQGLDLYETVKRNNNFYHGKQWEGLNAPDLEKPVFNIIQPSVNYLTSMLVSDDIGTKVEVNTSMSSEQAEIIQKVISTEVANVFEQNNIGYLNRDSIASCAIDGDTVRHHYWDTSIDTGNTYKGAIRIERLDNTCIVFGDKTSGDVQRQPYLILVIRMLTSEVRRLAKSKGVVSWEDIKPDNETEYYYNTEHNDNDGSYTTVLLKYWKENGTVYYTKATRDTVIEPETNTGLTLYPVSYFSWEKVKHSCHGVSPITSRIANQIYVNKLMAMAMEYNKKMAFPKLLYDRTKVRGWDNHLSKAIGVEGDPREAVYSVFQGAPVNGQALELVESTITKTKDSMGVYDAALGNAKPDNTSAIVALQRASSQPLELQRMDFYQFVEDSVRVIVDMMGAYYGLRYIKVELPQQQLPPMMPGQPQEAEPQPMLYDFSQLRNINMSLTVEIGQGTYWSELMQVQTLDNMLGKGMIDQLLYLELLPDGYIPNKDKIITSVKQAQQQQTMQQQQAAGQSGVPEISQLQQAIGQGQQSVI